MRYRIPLGSVSEAKDDVVMPFAFVIVPASDAARQRTRGVKSIAPELQLRPCLLLRSAANCYSKALPTCNEEPAPVKAPKQDSKPGVLRDSPTTDDRRWFPKNIEGRNSPGRALHRRFHRNFVAETVNLPGAI